MTRICASILVSIFCLHLQTLPTFADTEKNSKDCDLFDPHWTKRIPKDRYPCICDPIPFKVNENAINERAQFPSDLLSPFRDQEIVIQAQIERVMYSKLKMFNKEQFGKRKPLSCEIKYELTKDKEIRNIQIVSPSTDPKFTATVLQAANSLGSNFVGIPFKLGSESIQIQSVFTPDGVYPGFTRRLLMRISPTPNSLMDKLFE